MATFFSEWANCERNLLTSDWWSANAWRSVIWCALECHFSSSKSFGSGVARKTRLKKLKREVRTVDICRYETVTCDGREMADMVMTLSRGPHFYWESLGIIEN